MISVDVEANVIDPVHHGVHQVHTEHVDGAAVCLDFVEAGFDPIGIIAMQGKELGQAAGIGADPLVDPEHLRGFDMSGIIPHPCRKRRQPRGDQLVQPIGGLGTLADLSPGQVGGQARIGLHLLHQAIQTQAAGGQVAAQHRQPGGHVGDAGGGRSIDGLKLAAAIQRAAKRVDTVEHRADQVEAAELAVAAVGHQVQNDPALFLPLAESAGVAADPTVQGDQVGGAEAGVAGAACCHQALDQHRVEGIGRRDAIPHHAGVPGTE